MNRDWHAELVALIAGRGSNVEGYKRRMEAAEELTPEVLRDEFGHGGGTYTLTDGTRGHEWHSPKGVQFSIGWEDDRTDSPLFSWDAVAKVAREVFGHEQALF